MFNNQSVNHFIDTLSTNTVVPVVGWVEAIAETHHIHPPSIDGFRCALPILRGLGLIDLEWIPRRQCMRELLRVVLERDDFVLNVHKAWNDLHQGAFLEVGAASYTNSQSMKY
jgi:hypothetical protein